LSLPPPTETGTKIMQSKQVGNENGRRVWVLVLDTGEEAKHQITSFAKKEKIKAASFVALGAFQRAVVGYFDWDKKEYKPIPIDEQVEVITLVGDIAEDEKAAPSLHAHTVLGLSSGHTRGGHLIEGYVRPTLEVTMTETPAHLVRKKKPQLGLALIDIE
jgi:predicted DNA-binding protein with PD1-like motif